MRIEGVIFDLDGTLGNTLPVCFTAFRQVLRDYTNRTYSDQEIAALFGPSEQGIFQRLVPDHWQTAVESYLQVYADLHAEYGEEFPAIKDLLVILQQSHVRMAIVTGKGKESAEISLNKLGLNRYFEIVEAGSSSGANKPAGIRKILDMWEVEPGSVLYVGDSAYDMRAAREADVIPIAAAWSETAFEEDLNAAQPHALFTQVEQFSAWLMTRIN